MISTPTTRRDIIEWVLAHPLRERVLPRWGNERIIVYFIERFIDDEVIIVEAQETGMILGVMVAFVRERDREIFVDFVLTKHPTALRSFVLHWQRKYPTFAVIGKRQRGRRIRYTLKHFSRVLATIPINTVSHEIIASSTD